MLKICPRYAYDMAKICKRYAKYPLALLRQSESNIWQWLTKSQKHHSATHWLSNVDPREKICGPKMIVWSPVLHSSLDDIVFFFPSDKLLFQFWCKALSLSSPPLAKLKRAISSERCTLHTSASLLISHPKQYTSSYWVYIFFFCHYLSAQCPSATLS